MDTIPMMRSYLASKYEGAKWKKKVAIMDDSQVIAVYHSFKYREGKKKSQETPQQLSLFDESN